MTDVKLSGTEIRDLTRIERIGAHSHIRGFQIENFKQNNFPIQIIIQIINN